MKQLWIAVIFISVSLCQCCQKAVVTPKKTAEPETVIPPTVTIPQNTPDKSEEIVILDKKPSEDLVPPNLATEAPVRETPTKRTIPQNTPPKSDDPIIPDENSPVEKTPVQEDKVTAKVATQAPVTLQPATKTPETIKPATEVQVTEAPLRETLVTVTEPPRVQEIAIVEANECEIVGTVNIAKTLVDQLTSKLFGQHLATSIVSKAIKSHIENPNPSKALVLSFHGSSGVGKSYAIKLIAETLFRTGLNSPFVHHIRLGSAQIETEKSLEAFLTTSLEQCKRSLFIFEVDHISSNILNFLHNFIDYYGQFNSQRAIFILVSKEGENEINDMVLEASLTEEMRREDLKMEHFEKIITIAAYNGKGGLSRSILIDRGLIDIFVPFLPLEKKHVMQCIEEHLNQLNKESNMKKIERIAGSIQYFAGRFASTGCMKIMARSSLILDEDEPVERKLELEQIENSNDQRDKEEEVDRDEL